MNPDRLLDFISSGQVNALVPFTVATGTQQLMVASPGSTSAAVNITVNAVEPGLLAPSNFKIGGTQYVLRCRQGKDLAAPPQFGFHTKFALLLGAIVADDYHSRSGP